LGFFQEGELKKNASKKGEKKAGGGPQTKPPKP